MKKIIALLSVLVLFLSGCGKNDTVDAETVSGNITVSEADSEREPVTVKNHRISRLLNGYSYWYTNTNAEKILNIINRRDREELKSLISKSSRSESDIEKQMDILFEYIDGDFIDYEEGLPGEDNYVSYGETLRQSFSVVVVAKTEKTEYNLDINYVLKDDESEDNIGVEYICVTKKELSDYFFDNYDYQDQPKFPDEGGIWCMEKDGVIT